MASFVYPIFVDLAGVPVLVVGGGQVASRKAEGLAAAGAAVTVVAPRIEPGLAGLAARIEQRAYVADDLDGQQLVITATDDSSVNAAVAADARARGLLVNSADDPANCSFILPAIARAGRLTVAVSSGGGSPALAQHIRDTIAADVLIPDVVAAADVLAAERDALHAAGESTEGRDWAARLAVLLHPHRTPGER